MMVKKSARDALLDVETALSNQEAKGVVVVFFNQGECVPFEVSKHGEAPWTTEEIDKISAAVYKLMDLQKMAYDEIKKQQ